MRGNLAVPESPYTYYYPRLGQYSFPGLIVGLYCDRIHSSLTVDCFDDGYVGKQSVAMSTALVIKLQERKDRCTGRREITEMMLKTTLNTIQ